MTPATAEKLLTLWLRLAGVVCAVALVAVVMPRAWHVMLHGALGLGDFPEAPIAEYLARGMSATCGLIGLLFLYLARDVRRHRDVICFLTVALMAVSLVSTIVLHDAGMPRWWLYGDVGSVWGHGIMTLGLSRYIPRGA